MVEKYHLMTTGLTGQLGCATALFFAAAPYGFRLLNGVADDECIGVIAKRLRADAPNVTSSILNKEFQ